MANRQQRRAQERKRKKARTPSVMLAFPYGEFEPQFVKSLAFFFAFDATHSQHVIGNGCYLQYGTTNLPHGRNQIVKQLLETDCEWLWFVDTDQTFDPDVLERLLGSADPKEHPIVGALIFSFNVGDYQQFVPTLWTITDDFQPARVVHVPEPSGLYPFMTGTGCVLIHRSVFEGVRDAKVPGSDRTWGETAFPWFEYSEWINDEGAADVLGEDITFMVRAAAAGFVPWVDTRIEVGHRKTFTADLTTYLSEQSAIAAREAREKLPTFVVIPVKGHHDLTESLIDQLRAQGGYEHIYVLDNGADDDPFVMELPDDRVSVLPAAGKNLHEMWNAGVRLALGRAPDCNIAILNNDLRVGDEFLRGLVRALRADPRIGAVCPNYDGRPEAGFQQVHGICADRYDGTGGLAGFAFMARGDLFSAGLPLFDEALQWWFGDNDFVLNLERHGLIYGVATETHVEHLDGGSQTSKTEKIDTSADRDYFVEKWNATLVEA